jgi:hypothetical protein
MTTNRCSGAASVNGIGSAVQAARGGQRNSFKIFVAC